MCEIWRLSHSLIFSAAECADAAVGDVAAEQGSGGNSGGNFVINSWSRHCLQRYIIVLCEVATSGIGDLMV